MIHNKSADGLRGIASLSVALSHFLCAFIPMLLHRSHPYTFTKNTNPDLIFDIFQSPFFSLFYNGHLAVLIFFVLSGYVLAMPYYQNNTHALKHRLWGRYMRLNLPIAASVTLSFFIYRMGWYHNAEAATISGSTTWLNNFFKMGISWSDYFHLATYSSIFFGNGILNPPLWTLRVEFIGSIYLLTYYICKPKRYELLTMLFISGVLYLFYKGESLYFIAIFIGALLSKFKPNKSYLFPILISGLFFGAFQYETQPYNLLPEIKIFNKQLFDKKSFYHAVAAIFIVSAIINGSGKSLLESRPVQFLGRISYPLYLLHMLVLSSVPCYLLTVIPPSKFTLLFIFALYALLCFVSAWLFEMAVDRPSITLTKIITQRLFKDSDSQILTKKSDD